MPAEVETMYSVREVPWHGLGTIVTEAPSSQEAIKLAGLDWKVKLEEISRKSTGDTIKNYYANIRQSDGTCFGFTTDSYHIVQNSEAFDFTDELLGSGVKYETAGSLFGGSQIWLLAKMPETEILGDKVDPYLCFTNSHNGKGSIKICMTPIRVVCNNTLNLALGSASKSWRTTHTGDISLKMSEAARTLGLAEKYMEELNKKANILVNKDITDSQIKTIVYQLFPENENMTKRTIDNIENYRNQLLNCMKAPDIKKFENTQWGLVQGVSDFMTHYIPVKVTKTFDERKFTNIISNETIVDRTLDLLKAV